MKSKNFISNFSYWHLYIMPLLLTFCTQSLFSQAGNRDMNPLPSAISLPTNVPNKTKYKDMIGVNEVGYVFWDHVYNSMNGTVVRPTIANSFKNTFSKIRLFHDTEKDYNIDGLHSETPASTSTLNVCGTQNSRNYFCALKNFYAVLRPDYPFISSSLMAHRGDWPNFWFSGTEWGGTDTNIKEEAYQYAKAYLQNMDPTPASNPRTNLVNRLYTSNEAWGSSIGVNGYKAICDGLIEGFTEYYQGSRTATPNQSLWNIKMWLGAFQAADVSSIWHNDYIGNMTSTKAMNSLQGIDTHPYAFHQDAPANSSLIINQHPESDSSYFLSIKHLVKWRDDQVGNADTFKLSASEFGWNSSDVYARIAYPYFNTVKQVNQTAYVMQKNGQNVGSTQPTNPADWQVLHPGIGEEAQATYSVRAFLMLGRYGFESGYLYGSLNNEEEWFGTSGTYHTNIDTVALEGSNSGFFRFNVTVYGESASQQFAAPAHEKKIMPAMRKLRNTSLIGDKVYMQALVENNNGVYAYLVGNGTGTPTHLVAWYAKKVNNQNETQILANTIAQTLTQINFPTNLSISTATGYTRLDWNEASINNIVNTTVYNAGTSTLTLTPIPIVIPVSALACSNVTNAGTIGAAQNTCAPYNPTIITNTALPTGGTGSLEYVWQSSNTSATATDFVIISGANAATYDPTSINYSTWYQRGARRTGCPNYQFTTSLAKTSTNVTNAGVIAANQTVCGTNGTTNNPALLTSTSAAIGGTGITYKWQKATTAASGPYTDVSPAVTTPTYDPPAITQNNWYQRVAKNSTCTTFVPSNKVAVTYNAACSTTDIAVSFLEKCTLSNGNVRMKVKVDNLGTTTVSNVVVTFTGLCSGYNPAGTVAPSGTTYDPGFCPSFPQKWTINSSAPGVPYTLTIEYFLSPSASVTAAHSTAGDTNATNNSAQFTNTGLPTCAATAIDFAVSFSSKCIMPNGNIKMGVTATNLGTTALTNSVVTFTGLCNGYNSAGTTAPAGTTYDPGFCPSFPQKWTINNLAAGASSTLVIEYFLSGGVTITASNTTSGDGNTANNSANFVNTGLPTCVNGAGVAGKPNHTVIGEADLMTYPNPFSNILNYEVMSQKEVEAEIQLTSSIGQVVISRKEQLVKGSNKLQLSTDKIPTGMYFISVDTGEGNRMIKSVLKVE